MSLKRKTIKNKQKLLKGQKMNEAALQRLARWLRWLIISVKYSLNDMKENVILSADNASAFTPSIDMLDSGIQELRKLHTT